MVVNCTPRMLDRDLKDRYGADASQPDEGCGITRSKTELAGVPEAEAAGDIDVGEADADGAAEGFEAVVGVVGQASLPASAALVVWLLLSIALPTKPPIRPAMTARISPYRRSKGQRVQVLRPLLGCSYPGDSGSTGWA
jgi:predicted metal-binding membrane protein